jgi:ferritin
MTEEMKAKRQQLKQISRVVMMAVKEGQYSSINEGLADIYAQEGHTELNSFRGWIKKGFAVKKGEKALLLWGQPKESTKQEPQEGPEDSKNQFWPLAYVFSQNQVEPLKKTA